MKNFGRFKLLLKESLTEAKQRGFKIINYEHIIEIFPSKVCCPLGAFVMSSTGIWKAKSKQNTWDSFQLEMIKHFGADWTITTINPYSFWNGLICLESVIGLPWNDSYQFGNEIRQQFIGVI